MRRLGRKYLKFPTTTRSHPWHSSPDGTRLATGSKDARARTWDTASGQKLVEFRHVNAVTSVAFSPDGTRLATASSDTSAKIWTRRAGRNWLSSVTTTR